jgi:hypothetical protein
MVRRRFLVKRLIGILGIAFSLGCHSLTAPSADPESEAQWASLGRACDDDAPAPSLSPAARESLPPPPSPESNPNARWAALAGRVPGGWGGFFLEEGVPTIFLVDPALKHAAIEVLATEGFPVTSSTRAKQGRWDFAQLYDWYRYLTRNVSAIDGLSSSDIQEARNRIEFGVIDEAARGRLEQTLAALEVPCFLVAIEIRPRAVAL